jgi:hypothetical protein
VPGAIRQGWSVEMEVRTPNRNTEASSSGCETRPTKAAMQVGSDAWRRACRGEGRSGTATGSAMRRRANAWTVRSDGDSLRLVVDPSRQRSPFSSAYFNDVGTTRVYDAWLGLTARVNARQQRQCASATSSRCGSTLDIPGTPSKRGSSLCERSIGCDLRTRATPRPDRACATAPPAHRSADAAARSAAPAAPATSAWKWVLSQSVESFGSMLNLNCHAHALVPDGVFAC